MNLSEDTTFDLLQNESLLLPISLLRGTQQRVRQAVMQGLPLADALHEVVNTACDAYPTVQAALLLQAGLPSAICVSTNLPDTLITMLKADLPHPDALHQPAFAFTASDVQSQLTPEAAEALAQAGVQSRWSQPIKSADGKQLLGTLELFFNTGTRPTPLQLDLLDSLAELAATAIEWHSALEAQKRAETRLNDAQKRDLSQALSSERLLEETLDRFRVLLETLPEMAWTATRTGETDFLNSSMAAYTGLRQNQPGVRWQIILHPDDQEPANALWEAALSTKTEWSGTWRLRSATGEYRWMFTRAEPILNELGEVVIWLGTTTDVDFVRTEQEDKYAEQIRESRVMLERITYLSPSLITVFEVDTGAYRFVNKGAEHLLGIAPERLKEMGPQGYMGLIHPDDREDAMAKNQAEISQTLAEGATHNDDRVVEFEYRILHAEGTYRWVATRSVVFDREVGTGRFTQALNISIDITGRREMEERLRASESFAQGVANTSPDMIMVMDLNRYRFDYVSGSSIHILGRTPAQMMASTPEQIVSYVHPDSIADFVAIRQFASGTQPGTAVKEATIRIQLRDGTTRWHQVRATPFSLDAQGNPRQIISITRDVSEFREAMERLADKERYLTHITESTPDMVYVHNFALGHGVFANSAVEQTTGYPLAEYLAFSSEKVRELLHPDDREDFIAGIMQLRQAADGHTIEATYRFLTKHNGYRTINSRSVPFRRNAQGELEEMLSIGRDVTDTNQAAQDLQDSRQFLERITNTTPDVISVYDFDTEAAIFRSKYLHELVGYLPRDIDGKGLIKIGELVLEEDRHVTADALELMRTAPDGFIHEYEFRVRHADGSLRWLMGRSLVFRRHDDGTVKEFVSMTRDITERKQQEEQLKDSQLYLQSIADSSPDIITVYDLQKQDIVFKNREQTSLLGYSDTDIEKITPEMLFSLVHPDDREAFIARTASIPQLKDGEMYEMEYRMRNEAGEYIWISSRTLPFLRNAEGELTHCLNLSRNITERKLQEEQLKDSQLYLTRITESTPDLISIFDMDENRNIFVNRAQDGLLGNTADELRRLDGKALRGMILPEDQQLAADGIAKVLQAADGEVVETRFRGMHKDGKVRWMANRRLVFRRHADGSVKQYISLTRDITHEQEQAEALHESQLYFSRIAESTPDLIMVFDMEANKPLYTNRPLHTLFGYEAEEMKTMPVNDPTAWLHPDDEIVFDRRHDHLRIAKDGEVVETEYRVRMKDGSLQWFQSRALVFRRTPDGSVKEYISLSRNIHERRTQEERMMESERFSTSLADATPDGILVYRLADHRMIYTNRAVEEITGYTDVELQAMAPAEHVAHIHPDDQHLWVGRREAIELLKDGEPLEIEYRLRDKKGIWKWIAAKALVFKRSAKGQVLEYITIARDVTERKKQEHRLIESELLNKSITQTTPDVILVYRLEDHQTIYVNPACEAMLGFTPQEVLAMSAETFANQIHPDDRHLFVGRREKIAALADGESIRLEYRGFSKSGQEKWLNTQALVFKRDAEGQVVEYLAIARDVTESKRQELEVLESKRFSDSIAESTPDVITVFDLDTMDAVYLNREVQPMFGYKPEELATMSLETRLNTIHPDDQQMFSARYEAIKKLADGEIYELSVRGIHKKGHTLWINLRAQVFKRGDDGRVKQFISMTRDITTSKEAELSVMRTNALLEEAQAIVKLGTWEWDLTTDRIVWNKNLYLIFGLEPHSIPDLDLATYMSFVHPLDRDKVNNGVRHTLDTGVPFEVNHRIVWANGDVRYLLAKGKRINDAQGKAVRMAGAILDITENEHIQAELESLNTKLEERVDQRTKALAESDARFQLVALATNDTVRDWNLATGGMWWNENHAKLFGGAGPGWRDDFLMRVHPDDQANFLADTDHLVTSTESNWQGEYRYRHTNGTYANVLERMYVQRNEAGQAIRLVGALTDVTAQKQNESRLAFMNRSGEALNRSLDYREVYKELTEMIVPKIADWFRLELIEVDGYLETISTGHIAATKQTPYIQTRQTEKNIAQASKRAMAAKRTTYLNVGDESLLTDLTLEEDRSVVQQAHIKNAAVVPLMHNDRAFGAVSFYAAADGHVEFKPVDLQFFEDFAQRLALTIVNAQLYQKAMEEQERYRFLAESMPQLVWTTLPDGYHDYFNQRWIDFTGYSLEESQGPDMWNHLLHPDDRERARIIWGHSLATGEPYSIEYRFKEAATGKYRWFLGRALPMRNEQGKIVRWFGTCTDIDEAKRNTQAVEESAARLNLVLESIPALTWVSENGTNTFVNKQFEAYTGITVEKLLSEGWMQVLHPDDHERTMEAWHKSYSTCTSFQIEYRFRNREGQYRWFLGRGEPLLDAHGNATQWFGTCTDIEDSKLASERFSQMMEAQPSIAWTATAEGLVPYLNQRWYEYTGSGTEVLGSGWTDYVHPDDLGSVLNTWLACAAEGTNFEHELRYRSKAGHYRWFLAKAQQLPTEPGQERAWVGISVDVHDSKLASDRFKQIMESLPNIAWVTTAVGGVTYFNQPWYDYAGGTPGDFYGWSWDPVIHPDDMPMAIATLGQSFTDGSRFQMELRYRSKEGTYRWFLVQGAPVRDSAGIIQEWVGTSVDIHDNKLLSNRLRTHMEAQPNIAWTANAQGEVTYYNQRWFEFNGTTFEESKGWGWDIAVHPDEVQQITNQWMHSVSTGEPFNMEQRYKSKTGEYRWFDVKALPLRDNEGNITEWIGTSNDIHFTKIASIRFRTQMEAQPNIAWTTDPTGAVTFYNQQWFDFTGTVYDKVKGWGWDGVVHPDELESIVQQWTHSVRTGEPYSKEQRYKSKDGDYRWFSVKALPIHDEEGKIMEWIGTSSDIHEAKMASLRFLTQLEAQPSIAWTASPTGELTFYNQQWYTYTGTVFDEVSGWDWDKVVHPDDVEPITLLWTHSLRTGERFNMNQRYKSKDGEYRWFHVQAMPVRDSEGHIIEWVGTSNDIHDQLMAIDQLAEAQRELTASNKRLQRSNIDLDNFVYVASHDLKAPAVNIEALVSTMHEVMQNPEEAQELPVILEMIQTSVSRFKQTLEDLSDIARMQRDTPEDVSEVAFEDAYNVAYADLTRLADEAMGTIDVDFSLAPSVRFSRGGLRSVVYNLVSNAIKYREPHRKLHVQVWTEMNDHFTILHVKDNGMGMPERGREKVFTMFKRLHSHVEGSGVGLYIIKRAVENAGGTIDLETQEGVGSHFRVYFKR